MKYKNVRIPIEAYQKEKIRLDELNRKLRELTKNPKRKIPMTQFFRLRSSKPIFIYDEELINYFAKKKNGRFNLI